MTPEEALRQAVTYLIAYRDHLLLDDKKTPPEELHEIIAAVEPLVRALSADQPFNEGESARLLTIRGAGLRLIEKIGNSGQSSVRDAIKDFRFTLQALP